MAGPPSPNEHLNKYIHASLYGISNFLRYCCYHLHKSRNSVYAVSRISYISQTLSQPSPLPLLSYALKVTKTLMTSRYHYMSSGPLNG